MVKRKYQRTFLQVIAEASLLNFCNGNFFCNLADLAPTLEVCKDRLRALEGRTNNGGSLGDKELGGMSVLAWYRVNGSSMPMGFGPE